MRPKDIHTHKVIVKGLAKADVFDYVFYAQMFWDILFLYSGLRTWLNQNY